MNFFGGTRKIPDSDQVIDLKTGKLKPEWRDYFESLGSKDGDSGGFPNLLGSNPAREPAEHRLANTSSVAWDLSTAGQPKPFVPDGGIGNDQVAEQAITSDKIADGTIIPDNLADHSVTLVKIQQISTDKLLGRDTAATGNVEQIGVTNGIEFTGSTSIGIANDGVTNARLANVATSTIKGRVTASTGDPEDLSGTQVTTLLPDSSTTQRGVVELATDSEIRSAAASPANAVVAASSIESASALVALTDAATVAVDWDTGINFSLTVTANRAIGNPSNGQPGTYRSILVQGNSSTDRTITFGANYLGDVPVITDCDDARWYLLTIYCVTTSHFVVSSKKAKGT